MPKHRMCTEDPIAQLSDVDIDSIREELFEDRKILLNEPITDNIIYSVWHPLEQLIKLDDKEPITLYINSVGGDAYISLWLSSYIMKCPTVIRTVILGSAQSGASLIATAGTTGYRHAYTYSTIMVHLPRTTTDVGTSRELTSQAKGIEMLDEDIYDLLLNKTKMSKRVIKNKLQQDWYLGGSEALKYGIIDSVL